MLKRFRITNRPVYDDHGKIEHNGTKKGYLYVIDERFNRRRRYQHPRTTMDPGVEFLTSVRCQVDQGNIGINLTRGWLVGLPVNSALGPCLLGFHRILQTGTTTVEETP